MLWAIYLKESLRKILSYYTSDFVTFPNLIIVFFSFFFRFLFFPVFCSSKNKKNDAKSLRENCCPGLKITKTIKGKAQIFKAI